MADRSTRSRRIGYDLKTVNGQVIQVTRYDSNGRVLEAFGTTASTNLDSQAGFAKGAVYVKTDAASGTKSRYENVGTTSSSSFNLSGESVAGDITLAEGNILIGNSSGVGTALDIGNTNAGIAVGNGTTATIVTLSGDVTMDNTGAVTIANNAVETNMLNAGAVTGAKASNTLASRSVVANIGGFNATEQKFLFVAPFANCQIDNVLLVSDTATTGSDGSNNYEFQVQNLTQAEALLSAVATTNGGEIAADTAFAITPDQNNTDLAQGDVVELQITKNGTATDLSGAEVIVQVIYSSAD